MLAAAFSGILVHAGHCYQILVFTVPHFRDPGAYGTPLSGSWWFRAPPSGILVLAAAFSGIQVGLRPLFRHPGGFSPPPPPGSWGFRAPPFGILVGYFVAAFCFVRCTCCAWLHISRCFPWLFSDCRLIMPRPKGGAADEAAAEATAAAIAKELRGKFDSEVVRKDALFLFQ